MINSLMSRMNAANNLSVQQLHQAVADGTLPAYIGVPMIQDKMKQQQQAMAMQQPQQQPPIADQIMAASAPRRMPRREVMPQENQVESEVAQAPDESQGIEAAPSNLPTQMAQGGILSFADGGMDDQTEDDELEQLYGSGSDNDLIQAIAARGRGSDVHPSAAIQMRPESESIGFGKGHKYHDVVVKEAERQGLDPAIALHALYRETGGLKDPEKARSKAGAIGVMQLMPATAKYLGVDPTDPYQNIQGGVTYLKQMQDKYQNPQLTLMAYNAGPGRVDKALRSPQGLASLPSETRNYSEGGIAHFAGPAGSLVGVGGRSSGLPDDGDDTDNTSSTFGQSPTRGKAKSLASVLNDVMPSTSQRTRAVMPSQDSFRNAASQADDASFGTLPATNVAPAATGNQGIGAFNTPAVPMTGPTNQELGYDPTQDTTVASNPTGISAFQNPMVAKMLANIAESRAEAKKDRETNKYLALMQAGFGMMGGTSPYAAVNIGQGAEKGIGAYASLNQASSKEANDLQNQELALYKYGSAADAAAERNRIYGEIAGNKPDKYDIVTDRIAKDISIDPNIKSLEARRAKLESNGMLDYDTDKQIQNDINKAYAFHYKTHGREFIPSITEPITKKPAPAKPSFFSRIFNSSTPTPTTTGLPSADAIAAEKKRRAEAQSQGQ